MKKSIALALGLVLVAGIALASNTGFKLNYPVPSIPGRSNNNLISLPFFYFPNGNVGQTPQNGLDACFDFNGAPAPNTSNVVQVIQFQSALDQPLVKACSSTKPGFDLRPGEGYAVVPNATGPQQLDIVGSHDDNYAPNKGGTATYPLIFTAGRSNNNWVSVPYHIKADNGLDLCTMLNTAPAPDTRNVVQIVQFQTNLDQPLVKACSSTKPGFDLKPGEGYILVPNATGTLAAAYDVY